MNAFWAALKAADPAAMPERVFPEAPKGRLVVVGAGKASAAMAARAERHYGDLIDAGLVITRYGHSVATKRIRIVEAAHPVPDAAGAKAASEILRLVSSLDKDDLLLCLISGGGSALLTAPDGISLELKAELTQALLKSGADIHEMNAVRKHLSRIKGGRLAAAANPARVVSLLISDVTGDDLSTIASGPTAPDPSTFEGALEILDRYDLEFLEVRAQLEKGVRGELPETPKSGDPIFERVENKIVASAQNSLQAAAAALQEAGITPLILSEAVTGEAREAAKFHAAIAKQVLLHEQPLPRPCALLSGGETTVTVKGSGRGGRNSEFLLALALELRGLDGIYALAADTDGIDGSEDAAGAWFGPDLLKGLERRTARSYLDNNDAYSFFERAGTLIKTGPTLTNVNDFRLILLEHPSTGETVGR